MSVSPEKVTIVEGNNLLLTCNGSGEPEPSISWTRIGSSNVLSVSPSLTIVNVSRSGTADNMIQYQCTVSNGVGTPATATVYVTVVCKYSSIRCTVTVFWRPLNSSNFCATCSRNRWFLLRVVQIARYACKSFSMLIGWGHVSLSQTVQTVEIKSRELKLYWLTGESRQHDKIKWRTG